jgi:IclR family pca regulon transcriptional regulator
MSNKQKSNKHSAAAPRTEHLESLARGLSALELFGTNNAHDFTMIDVAQELHITRAAALRVLGTLESLGYLHCENRRYSLAPRVLAIGYAYLASLGFRNVAKPIVDALAQDTGETCSIGVLDRDDVVYVLRAETRRIVRIDLNVGSRLPAYLNSMGRVLLAALPDKQLDAYLRALRPVAVTRRTVTDKAELKERIVAIRRTGWCYIDGEVEESIAGLATPIRDRDGNTIAALNLSLAFSQLGKRKNRAALLRKLAQGTREIEHILHNNLPLA